MSDSLDSKYNAASANVIFISASVKVCCKSLVNGIILLALNLTRVPSISVRSVVNLENKYSHCSLYYRIG